MKERRFRNLFQSRQMVIAGCMMLILVTCLTGVFFVTNITKQKEKNELAKNQQEAEKPVKQESVEQIADRMLEDVDNSREQEEMEQASVTVTKRDNSGEKKTEEKSKQTQAVGTAAIQSDAKKTPVQQHFDGTLMWPTKGSILMDYSMDQSIYFQSLDQYKYNPAMIIQSEEGNQTVAAAAGTVTKVDQDATTGMTLTMDIGDGYQLVYGQLKDLVFSEGAHVDAGDVIGCISAPTKYYSEEGSNLYFAMTKDGKPVNPSDFLTD